MNFDFAVDPCLVTAVVPGITRTALFHDKPFTIRAFHSTDGCRGVAVLDGYDGKPLTLLLLSKDLGATWGVDKFIFDGYIYDDADLTQRPSDSPRARRPASLARIDPLRR